MRERERENEKNRGNNRRTTKQQHSKTHEHEEENQQERKIDTRRERKRVDPTISTTCKKKEHLLVPLSDSRMIVDCSFDEQAKRRASSRKRRAIHQNYWLARVVNLVVFDYSALEKTELGRGTAYSLSTTASRVASSISRAWLGRKEILVTRKSKSPIFLIHV